MYLIFSRNKHLFNTIINGELVMKPYFQIYFDENVGDIIRNALLKFVTNKFMIQAINSSALWGDNREYSYGLNIGLA